MGIHPMAGSLRRQVDVDAYSLQAVLSLMVCLNVMHYKLGNTVAVGDRYPRTLS